MEQVTSISNRGASYPSSAAARGTANRVQAPIIDPSNRLTLRARAQRALKTLVCRCSVREISLPSSHQRGEERHCAVIMRPGGPDPAIIVWSRVSLGARRHGLTYRAL